MAFSVAFLYEILDKYTAPLKKMGLTQKNFQKHIDTSKDKLKKMRKTMTNNMVKTIGYTAAFYGLTKAFTTGIELASDLTEVQNVVSTTFGDSEQKINDWSSQALNSFGLSELQAKRFTGTLGAMLKSANISGNNLVNMSTSLTGLAGDFASFYNLPHEAAFDKIRAGIVGETEPLKALGINMSVANLEAFALTQGMTKQFKQMTQSEQVMLRYNFIMKASKDAQGDFAKTLETSFANQKRVLKTRFSELLAKSFSKLLPYLTKALITMNEFVASIDPEKVGAFFEKIAKGVGIFIKFLKYLRPVVPIILGVVAAWKAYSIITTIVAAKQLILNALMTANPIGLIITGIGILIGIIIILYKNWDKVTVAMHKVWEKTKGFISFVNTPLAGLIETVKSLYENWQYIKIAFTDKGILAGIWAIAKALVSGLIAPLQTILEVASKIPKIGKWAKVGADQIKKFREGLFAEEQQMQMEKSYKDMSDNMHKTTKKTKEELKKPIDTTALTKASSERIGTILAMKEAQYKAREKMAFTEKYVRTPTTVNLPERENTVNANMNLRVYNETGAKIVPMKKSSNLGYNEVGM